MKRILMTAILTIILANVSFAQRYQTGRNGVVDMSNQDTVKNKTNENVMQHEHHVPPGIDMKGTNPHVHSYETDTAILNRVHKPYVPPAKVDMKGTNPQVNSYDRDTAILNRAHKPEIKPKM